MIMFYTNSGFLSSVFEFLKAFFTCYADNQQQIVLLTTTVSSKKSKLREWKICDGQ